jgi:hypothetical protein
MFYSVSDQFLLLMADILGIHINEIALKDNFKTKIKPGFYICNLDDDNGAGTHWTCFYVVGKFCLYFDSFGLPMPNEIKRYTKKYTPLSFPNQIQDIRSEACGYYCLDFIQHFSKFKANQLDTRLKIGRRMSLFGEPYDYNNRSDNEKVLKLRIENINIKII